MPFTEGVGEKCSLGPMLGRCVKLRRQLGPEVQAMRHRTGSPGYNLSKKRGGLGQNAG